MKDTLSNALTDIKWWVEDNKKLAAGLVTGFVLVVLGILIISRFTHTENTELNTEIDYGLEDTNVANTEVTERIVLPTDPVDRTGGDEPEGQRIDSVGQTYDGLYLVGVNIMDLDLGYLQAIGQTPNSYVNYEMLKEETGLELDESYNGALVINGQVHPFQFTTMEELAYAIEPLIQP